MSLKVDIACAGCRSANAIVLPASDIDAGPTIPQGCAIDIHANEVALNELTAGVASDAHPITMVAGYDVARASDCATDQITATHKQADSSATRIVCIAIWNLGDSRRVRAYKISLNGISICAITEADAVVFVSRIVPSPATTANLGV